MKIESTLTPEESKRIKNNIEFRGIEEITKVPQYNAKTDSFVVDNVEYPTEEEAYEAIDEMEI